MTDLELTPAITDDRARRLLLFEAEHPGHAAGKEEAIRRELALTPPRYYQLLSRLVDTDQALRIDPVLTHRLRRIRDHRQAEHQVRAGIHTPIEGTHS